MRREQETLGTGNGKSETETTRAGRGKEPKGTRRVREDVWQEKIQGTENESGNRRERWHYEEDTNWTELNFFDSRSFGWFFHVTIK